MTITVKPEEISFARPLTERLRDSWHSLIGALKRDPVLAASVFVLLLGLFLVAFSTFLTKTDYTRVDPFFRLNAPSGEHWFGTDDTGRDVFDRVLVGTRISFLVGFMVTALSALFGTTIGMLPDTDQMIAGSHLQRTTARQFWLFYAPNSIINL